MTTMDSGTRDPTRALELLWGTARQPRRGPKQGLRLERIVATAIGIADSQGLSGLSMRGVAAELGVSTTSLYTYLPGKPELVALMLDAVIGSGSLPHTWPGGWRDKLAVSARTDWTQFRRRPWLLWASSARPVPGPNLVAWYDSALRALSDTGLDTSAKLAVLEAVDGYALGMARITLDAVEEERRTGVPDRTWNELEDAYLSTHVDFSPYPAFAQAIGDGAAASPEANFEFGLQRMLDGIEAFVRSSGT